MLHLHFGPQPLSIASTAGTIGGGVAAGTAGTVGGMAIGPISVWAMGAGAGRNTANLWNTNFHDPMWQKFVAIANDPNHTPDQLLGWWQQYLTTANQFVTSAPAYAKAQASTVINQDLSTGSFMQSVDRLWNQLGGPQQYGVNSIVAVPQDGN